MGDKGIVQKCLRNILDHENYCTCYRVNHISLFKKKHVVHVVTQGYMFQGLWGLLREALKHIYFLNFSCMFLNPNDIFQFEF